jgi:hypothetical protein
VGITHEREIEHEREDHSHPRLEIAANVTNRKGAQAMMRLLAVCDVCGNEKEVTEAEYFPKGGWVLFDLIIDGKQSKYACTVACALRLMDEATAKMKAIVGQPDGNKHDQFDLRVRLLNNRFNKS